MRHFLLPLLVGVLFFVVGLAGTVEASDLMASSLNSSLRVRRIMLQQQALSGGRMTALRLCSTRL